MKDKIITLSKQRNVEGIKTFWNSLTNKEKAICVSILISLAVLPLWVAHCKGLMVWKTAQATAAGVPGVFQWQVPASIGMKIFTGVLGMSVTAYGAYYVTKKTLDTIDEAKLEAIAE